MHRDNCKIYIGNLPEDFRERDVDDLFYKFGKIRNIEVKGKRGGSAFAFVEYDDPRDADDAIRDRDGYRVEGGRIRVEAIKGVGPRGRGGEPVKGDRNDFQDTRSKRNHNRQLTGFRIEVSGLPSSGSWQDLKDHMRKAGEISFADVFKDGTGIVEFRSADSVDKAIRDLHDTKFKSHEGETAYIRVKKGKAEGSSHGKSRSRSRSNSAHSARSVSPRRSRSRSHSSVRSGGPRRSPSQDRIEKSHSKSPRSKSHSKSRSPSVDRRSGGSKSDSPAYDRGNSQSRSPSKSPKADD
uniref:Serine/arginine-rich splicing factor 1 n=1 Tax=Rhabditophanes sp. KR3021 TaxID=114890 RepID=A0AC35U332_9BILA